MRRLTYLEGLRSTVRRYPEEVAVVAVDGREITYRELDERTDALAAALESRLGSTRCAGLAENRLATIELMLASMKRGRASVQLPTRGAVGELAAMSETAGSGGLLYDAATAEQAAELAEQVDVVAPIVVGDAGGQIDGAESYEGVVAGADPYEGVVAGADPADAPTEPATDPPEYAVHFTSGTTGEPKAVLVDQEQTWLAANQPGLEMGLTAGDRALVCTPWYHGVTCFTWIFAHLLVGGTLVLQRSFEPIESLRLLEAHSITGLLAVPTQLEALLRAQDDVEADVSALSYVRTGGAVVPESLIEQVRQRLTDGVFNTYGQTEAVIDLSFAYPHEQDDHPGTIGKGTYLWELRAVEPADPPAEPDPQALAQPGDVGEILARGPRMIDGYLDRPALSQTIFVAGTDGPTDRWLRTGDVARVDGDGYLVVVDRIDNMLVSGGENVYPEEVQRALKDHPAVVDAGVVGLPDETWGEVVAAAVATAGDVTEDDLDQHCKDHDTLADFKRPRRYVFVDEVPRTATGTVVRDEVESTFEP